MSLWVHRVFSCQAPCQASFRHLPWASSPMMDVALRTRFCPRRAHCWCQSPWSFAFGRFVLNFPLTHSMWWLSNFRSRGVRGSWGADLVYVHIEAVFGESWVSLQYLPSTVLGCTWWDWRSLLRVTCFVWVLSVWQPCFISNLSLLNLDSCRFHMSRERTMERTM